MKASTSTVEESILTFRQSLLVIFGLITGISVIFAVFSSIFGEKISASAKARYDTCVAIEQDAGVGIITADDKCDYLKRAR